MGLKSECPQPLTTIECLAHWARCWKLTSIINTNSLILQPVTQQPPRPGFSRECGSSRHTTGRRRQVKWNLKQPAYVHSSPSASCPATNGNCAFITEANTRISRVPDPHHLFCHSQKKCPHNQEVSQSTSLTLTIWVSCKLCPIALSFMPLKNGR